MSGRCPPGSEPEGRGGTPQPPALGGPPIGGLFADPRSIAGRVAGLSILELASVPCCSTDGASVGCTGRLADWAGRATDCAGLVTGCTGTGRIVGLSAGVGRAVDCTVFAAGTASVVG